MAHFSVMASHPSFADRIAVCFPPELREQFRIFQERTPKVQEARMDEDKRMLILRYLAAPALAAPTEAEVEAKALAESAAYVLADDGSLRRIVVAAEDKTVKVVAAADVYDVIVATHLALGHMHTARASRRLRDAVEGVHVKELGWARKHCRVCCRIATDPAKSGLGWRGRQPRRTT
jgi:hypothetical protein